MALVAVVAAATPAAASADYGPGGVPASAVGRELMDRDSLGAALAGDGRYAVFLANGSVLGALAGFPPPADQVFSVGVVRKDLVTGAVALVTLPERRWAAGAQAGQVVHGTAVAGGLSVSADGRYVLFATAAPLSLGDANTATTDVYVRDMTRPLSGQSSYELVSALDGVDMQTTVPRTPRYDDPALGSAPGATGYGLSDDGRTAVFITRGATNLPAGGGGTAPRWQVLVRSLDANTTRLVTRDRQDRGLPGTPVAPVTTGDVTAPVPRLSGNGSAVTWVGTNAGRQARFLPDEQPALLHFLWRDLTAGPSAPARRVTGIADVDDPACPPAAQDPDGPCAGPFATAEALSPAGGGPGPGDLGISDDGRRVLFQSAANLRSDNTQSYRPNRIYVADMSPGVSRKSGTRLIASVPNSEITVDVQRGFSSPVLAGDGRHAVFVSRGTFFDGVRPLGAFQTGQLDTSNVFVTDLDAGTVERVTRAPSGADYRGPLAVGSSSDPNPRNLTMSDDGSAIAFDAADGNLFVGDANGVRDVQVVRRATSDGGDGPGLLGGPIGPPAPDLRQPPLAPLPPIYALFGYVRLGARGVATVQVRVPAAGHLTASATARPRGQRKRLTVGRDAERPKRAATVTLRIRPSAAARRALRRGRLAVSLRLQFKPRAGSSSTTTRRYTLRPRQGT